MHILAEKKGEAGKEMKKKEKIRSIQKIKTILYSFCLSLSSSSNIIIFLGLYLIII